MAATIEEVNSYSDDSSRRKSQLDDFSDIESENEEIVSSRLTSLVFIRASLPYLVEIQTSKTSS